MALNTAGQRAGLTIFLEPAHYQAVVDPSAQRWSNVKLTVTQSAAATAPPLHDRHRPGASDPDNSQAAAVRRERHQRIVNPKYAEIADYHRAEAIIGDADLSERDVQRVMRDVF